MTSTTSLVVRFTAFALLAANTLAMPTFRMYYAPAPVSPPAPKTSSGGGGGGAYRKPAPGKAPAPQTSSGGGGGWKPASGGCNDPPAPAPMPQTSSGGGGSSGNYYKPKTKPATASQNFGSAPAPAWEPKPQTAPAQAPAKTWGSSPGQQTSPQTAWRPVPATAPGAAPAQPWHAPAAAPTPSPSPSASPWPSPVPPPGSSVDLGDTEASAIGNNTLSVAAEEDKAAAAGNGVDGNALILGATPGQAIGLNAPLAAFGGFGGAGGAQATRTPEF